jgi:hypothetical protein
MGPDAIGRVDLSRRGEQGAAWTPGARRPLQSAPGNDASIAGGMSRCGAADAD